MAVFEEASKNSHTEVTNRKIRGCQTLEKTGRDERIRTSDPLNPIYIRTPATTGFQHSYSGETRRDTANNRTFCTLYAPCSLFSEPLQLFFVSKIEAERRSLSIKHLNLISRFHSWQNKKREQGTGSHRIKPMQ